MEWIRRERRGSPGIHSDCIGPGNYVLRSETAGDHQPPQKRFQDLAMASSECDAPWETRGRHRQPRASAAGVPCAVSETPITHCLSASVRAAQRKIWWILVLYGFFEPEGRGFESLPACHSISSRSRRSCGFDCPGIRRTPYADSFRHALHDAVSGAPDRARKKPSTGARRAWPAGRTRPNESSRTRAGSSPALLWWSQRTRFRVVLGLLELALFLEAHLGLVLLPSSTLVLASLVTHGDVSDRIEVVVGAVRASCADPEIRGRGRRESFAHRGGRVLPNGGLRTRW